MFGRKSLFDARELKTMANAARMISLEEIQTAASGHPGVALGFADVMTTLFANHLNFDPTRGDWAGRDRFVLSAGHASALLYAVLHLAGFPITREKLKSFRRIGGLPGHPERDLRLGIEMTTGPLGQGLASAVGIAIAKPDVKVFVAVSDGDLMEGVASEAASLAGFRRLRNLIVLWDDNNITIDGQPARSEDIPARFRATGWNTIEIDGNDPREINRAIRIAKKMRAPVLICCRTKIGLGSALENTADAHGKPLDYADAMRMMSELSADFDAAAPLWKILKESKSNPHPSFATARKLAKQNVPAPASGGRIKPVGMPKSERGPTRELFNRAINAAIAKNPDLIFGGAADLTDSTGARVPEKNLIHFGVREFAMAAAANGMAMSGLRPFCATFLVFSDYMRPAIRLAALMRLPTLFVFSHDSIALGEDGPTHQPVEQLPSLRLIPGLRVFRPCNMSEMFLCLRKHFDSPGPSAIITTRQAFENPPDAGDAHAAGYIIYGAKNARVRFIATGSEVALAIAAAKVLESKKITAAVMSAPSLELMMKENRGPLAEFIGSGFSVWIEASAQIPPFSVSMIVRQSIFGESGPGAEVYKKSGFDAEYIADEIMKKINK
ncbi:MAG: hypothetical protein LBL46_03765 [Rickettsiales bacterium]|jgi:transketolase|nr:hypothetical protein [Rickettsiales bacterium]